MALVSNPCQPDLRICEPSLPFEFPSPEEESESRSHLLHKIHTSYLKAQKRLERNAKRLVAALARFLCVGLLDPVSNIVINNLISCKRDHESYNCKRGEGLHRSLDGLVTFLTRLFPNLAESQAVRYLLLADADVLVAARVVVSDFGMKRFEDSEPAVIDMALKCAALAAGHPDPDRLVYAWRNISSRINDGLQHLALLRKPPSLSSYIINKLAKMLNEGPPGCDDVWCAWRLAASRRLRPCSVPYQHTSLLNRTLQDVIHGFYLLALTRLPAGSRFHRSLLKAGHCYGPLDPVSNIIINTIWYDAAFPRTMKLELDMIGTRSLHRMENRSLFGLASFLCTRYHRFNFHQAVRCLVQAEANLVLADPNLDPTAYASASFGMGGGVLSCGPAAGSLCNVEAQDPPCTSLEEAFLAAATAACHPNSDAQVKLLTSCKAMLGSALSLLQPSSHKLSSQDVQRLAMLLSPESPYDYERRALLPALPLTGYPRAEVANVHTRISKKVNALLNAYEQMPNGDPKFELHTICCSHVNFLATPKSLKVPILFFAEISNDDCNDMSFCCPVDMPPPCAAQIRCLFCEFTGTRIVHPVGIDFHGRESEFEKMACGKDPCEGLGFRV